YCLLCHFKLGASFFSQHIIEREVRFLVVPLPRIALQFIFIKATHPYFGIVAAGGADNHRTWANGFLFAVGQRDVERFVKCVGNMRVAICAVAYPRAAKIVPIPAYGIRHIAVDIRANDITLDLELHVRGDIHHLIKTFFDDHNTAYARAIQSIIGRNPGAVSIVPGEVGSVYTSEGQIPAVGSAVRNIGRLIFFQTIINWILIAVRRASDWQILAEVADFNQAVKHSFGDSWFWLRCRITFATSAEDYDKEQG